MNLKVLFIVFLIIASLSAICNVAVTTLKAPMPYSQNGPVAGSYLMLNGTEPEGDPRPPVWPK